MSLPVDVPILNLPEERAVLLRHHENRHVIVKDLAEKFSCPIAEVEKVLSAAEHELEHGARIKVFVPLLAIKQVKDLLRPNQHTLPRHEPHDLNPPSPSHHQAYP